MAKPPTIDPNMRACWLVGQFLQAWAAMESAINNAIGKALGLQILQTAIVCANLGFRDKVNILKTAVDISPIYPVTDREAFKETLDRVQEYSRKRNMIAHNMFAPTEDGKRVSFSVTKAAGSLAFPPTEWGDQQFADAFRKLGKFTERIQELTDRLNWGTFTEFLASSRRRAIVGLPTPAPDALTMFGPLNLPPLDPPHSTPEGPPSKPEKAGKIPRPSPASKSGRKRKPPNE